jgi:hypothetical protein
MFHDLQDIFSIFEAISMFGDNTRYFYANFLCSFVRGDLYGLFSYGEPIRDENCLFSCIYIDDIVLFEIFIEFSALLFILFDI